MYAWMRDQLNGAIAFSRLCVIFSALVVLLICSTMIYFEISPGAKKGLMNSLFLSFKKSVTPKERENTEKEVSSLILKNSRKLTGEQALRLAKIIVGECREHGLDPLLVLAVIKVESSFQPGVVSKRGAIGLMQVLPSTGNYVAGKMGFSFGGAKSLYDPHVNVRVGIRYLAMLQGRYNSVERALVAYNFGPNRAIVKRAGIESSPPLYVRRIMGLKSRFENEVRGS